MKTQYKRWQVILGFVVWLAVMGLVGTIDQNSQHGAPVYYDQYAGGGR